MPTSPAVYRRRRIVVGLLALIVLVGLGFAVWAVIEAVRGDAAPIETSSSPTPSPTSSSTPSPATAATPAQPSVCEPEHASLSMAAPAPVPAGSSVRVPTVVRNDGEEPCLIDLGSDHLVLTVYSGQDQVWSSLDCPAGAASRELLLAPGAEDSQDVRWTGFHSIEGCPADQPRAQAGSYRLVVEAIVEDQTLSAEVPLIMN